MDVEDLPRAPGPILRLLVLAEDPLARAGLAGLLDEAADLDVVGQASLGPDALTSAEFRRPDLVVADLGWTPETGSKALGALDLGVPLVLLVPRDEAETVAWGLAPQAILAREASGDRLRAAIRAAAAGWLVLDPAFMPPGDLPARDLGPAAELTAREREVLRLVAEGLPNKAIAHHLGISEHTVKFHVDAILSKLGAQSRTEAAIRAARLGLVAL